MVNDVLIINQKGNAVIGLKKEDFVITEDGALQEIGLFSFGENITFPKSIVLIIDRCVISPEQLKNSVEAAKNLVDKLNPQDQMAIVTDEVTLLTDFTTDKTWLKKKLETIKIDFNNLFDFRNKKAFGANDGGRGEQFSSLLAVLNEKFNDPNTRPIVIIQSGGGEFRLLKPIHEELRKVYRERDFSFDDVQEAVEKSRATIYPIVIGRQLVGFSMQKQQQILRAMFDIRSETNMGGKEYESDFIKKHLESRRSEYLADQEALVKIANLSGGYVNFFTLPEDAESIYSDIFTVINNRYVIGYYPTNQAQKGKKYNFKIEVKGHPEYMVLGRKNYYVPE